MAVQLTTTSTERPTDATPGTLLLETDTNRMIVWDGSAWQLYLPDARQDLGFENSRSVYLQTNFTQSSADKYFQLATQPSAPTLQSGVKTISMSMWFCFHVNSTNQETSGILFTTGETSEIENPTSLGHGSLPRSALKIDVHLVKLLIDYNASGEFNFNFINPAGTSLADGNWHHLVLVSEINPSFSVSSKNMLFQVKCWIDGAPAEPPGTFSNDTRITGFSDTSTHGEVIPLGTDNAPMFDGSGVFDSASDLSNSCYWRTPSDIYTIRAHSTHAPGEQNALMGAGAAGGRDRIVFGMIDGASGNGSDSNSGFWIDEVALWDTALTSSEVTSIYSGGASIDLQAENANYQSHTDLKHWWRMGDDEDATPGALTGVTGVKDSVTGSNCTVRSEYGTGLNRNGWPDITAPLFTDFSVKSDGTTGTRPDAETEYDGKPAS